MIVLPELKSGYVLFIYTINLKETLLLMEELKQLSIYNPISNSDFDPVIYMYIDNNNSKESHRIYSISREAYEEGYYNEPHYIHINFRSIYYNYDIDVLMNNLDKLKEKYE